MKAMVGSSAGRVLWKGPSQRHTSKNLAIMVQINCRVTNNNLGCADTTPTLKCNFSSAVN